MTKTTLPDPQLVKAITDILIQAKLHSTCLSCHHFSETDEVCRLAGQRPPARIIATGCPSYQEEPPF